MDKKTRFKLNFIKDHLKNARLGSKKPSKRHRKLLMLKEGGRPLILYKHFNPISIHRIIGDLVFLDTLGMVDDFVPLSTLWTPFKYISDIVIEGNFSICNKQDSGIFSPHSDFLIDRLLSLGQTVCYNLAMSIIKFSKAFLEVPLAKGEKPRPVQLIDESKQLQTFLRHNSQYPIIMYHYVPHAKLGVVNSKIAINNVLRDMTFQDSIRVFEESLFVCPTSEYYTYMIAHLESCFSTQKDQYFGLYVNTKHGVKKFMASGENFTLNAEKVVVITFPRSAQNSDIQCLYDDPCESKAKPITSSNKKTNKSVIRSFRDWEHLIRRYFDPAVGEEEQRRCHYRVIDNGSRGQYPLELKF